MRPLLAVLLLVGALVVALLARGGERGRLVAASQAASRTAAAGGTPELRGPAAGRPTPGASRTAVAPAEALAGEKQARHAPEAESSIPGIARRARPGRHAAIAEAMGWPPDAWQAGMLRDWLARRSADERDWLQRTSAALTPDGELAVFNARADLRSQELVDAFGRDAAVSVAARLKLRRVDARTGELVLVTLDGRAIANAGEED